MNMEYPTPEQIWAAYVERVREGYGIPNVGNFLGGVEVHKEWFMEAMASLLKDQ
jgi:hypothetical protein